MWVQRRRFFKFLQKKKHIRKTHALWFRRRYFLLVAMATTVLHKIEFFEQLWQSLMPETSTPSLIKFGQVFRRGQLNEKVYRWTDILKFWYLPVCGYSFVLPIVLKPCKRKSSHLRAYGMNSIKGNLLLPIVHIDTKVYVRTSVREQTSQYNNSSPEH